jgi:cyclophilin family peptidyl-prolyl cis-trans isomerase
VAAHGRTPASTLTAALYSASSPTTVTTFYRYIKSLTYKQFTHLTPITSGYALKVQVNFTLQSIDTKAL